VTDPREQHSKQFVRQVDVDATAQRFNDILFERLRQMPAEVGPKVAGKSEVEVRQVLDDAIRCVIDDVARQCDAEAAVALVKDSERTPEPILSTAQTASIGLRISAEVLRADKRAEPEEN